MADVELESGVENDALLESETPSTPLSRIEKLHEAEETVTDRPSIFVRQDDAIDKAIAPVFYDWNLLSPDIIITFVSGTRSYTAWKHGDHRAALQKGVIKTEPKAARLLSGLETSKKRESKSVSKIQTGPAEPSFTVECSFELQLIKATETWLIDIGLDYGLSKTIGDAIKNEQCFRKSVDRKEVFARGYFKRRRHGINLFGIAPLAILKDARKKEDADSLDDYAHTQHKFDLNSSHTHYVFVDGAYKNSKVFRVSIEKELARQASMRRSPTLLKEKDKKDGDTKTMVVHEEVPLLAILVQGDHVELDQVHAYLTNGIPVLVIRGTGFLADVLAQTLEEFRERGGTAHDLEQLKPTVSKRLARSFCPACMKSDADRVIIRDKLLECVQLSMQDDRKLLTITESSEDLVDLQDAVLSAVFASRSKNVGSSKEQLRADFMLTMRLNKPAIAETKVLARDEGGVFQADNHLFEKALLWKDREVFVERFMEEDFCLHKFLNHSTLLRLFRRAEDNEFFVSVVWEQIPRHYFDFQVDETFLTRDLTFIVQKLTGISSFVSMYELSSNFMGRYVDEECTAERKAMNALILWAILMNRFSMVKVFWKFCENPIPMALFISAMYRGLAKYSTSPAVVNALEASSKAFSIMAIDVLEMSYKESSARTFDLLNQKFEDFNEKTPVKMAYASENKYFLSHDACQVWLSWLWDGGLEIAESWNSRIPEEVKIILSAVLLFPISYWIVFPRKNFARHPVDTPAPDAVDSAGGVVPYSVRLEANDRYHIMSSTKDHTESNLAKLKALQAFEQETQKRQHRHKMIEKSASSAYYMHELPFWRKVYYLWTTPRTKFWMFQVFYWVYLVLFSVATITPTCNEWDLDVVVVIWTAFILAEIVLRTMSQRSLDFPVNMPRRLFEVVFLSLFIVTVALLKLQFGFLRPYYMRAAMAVGLLYMYYRMVAVFFPMNRMLGPMLYRIKRMISVDFFLFVRLAAPFIIANMFAIQAVMYPDQPFGLETIRKGFYRAFFSLFIAFVGELDYTQKCEELRVSSRANDTCWVGNYETYRCPTLGVTSYAISIQYLIIMRLILVVLLNALFAATMIKVKEDADYIFKYQRYDTVLDFAARPALPPPLTFLNYFFNWMVFLLSKLNKVAASKKKSLTTSRMVKLIQRKAPEKRSTGSYSYWMGLTKEYYRKKAKEEKEKKIAQDQTAKIKTLAEEQKVMRNTVNRLTDKLKETEQVVLTYLEAIKHGVERKDIPKENRVSLNVLSRVSPYPGTEIRRFLVGDQQVSWTAPVDIYEPPNYSKPVEDYADSEKPYVDPAIASLSEVEDKSLFFWNAAAGPIDRRSFIKNVDGEAVPYEVAENGLPRNPIGRTGLTGRGCLPRFGPNTRVKIVLSRIKDDKLVVLVARGFPNEATSLFPKKALAGSPNLFSCSCNLFGSFFVPPITAKEVSARPPQNMQQMLEVMEAEATGGARLTEKVLEVKEIFAGYVDDPKNTDNAWIETLAWHIHIVSAKSFSRRRTEEYIWKEPGDVKNAGPMEEHFMEIVVMRKGVD